MGRSYLVIEEFSTGEVTEMFNAICNNILNKSPIDVKKSLLGIKNATKDTKVSLSHLMILIEKNNIEYSFKVTYHKDNSVADVKPIEPDFFIGLRKDPIIEEMESQSREIGDIPDFGL